MDMMIILCLPDHLYGQIKILVILLILLYSGAVQSLHEDFVRSSADATRGCLSKTDRADCTAETSDSAGRG